MPSIDQPIPLWFVFATIAVLLTITAAGIWAVLAKKKKLSQKKEA